MSILILGGGYIGSAFSKECGRRELSHLRIVSSIYRRRREFRNLLEERQRKIDFVICCAAFIPMPSVAECDKFPDETIRANVCLPQMLAAACADYDVPFAHISTGCMWSDGLEHSEDDSPQRAYSGHCGFYVGTKYTAEQLVAANCEEYYIWRVRLPFDEVDHPKNYLSKLARFEQVWEHENTICHRGDFVKGCLDLWQNQAPWGTYHVANPGSIKAMNLAAKLVDAGIRSDLPEIVAGPQGGSILSVKKMEAAGVKLRPVEEAVADAIKNWRQA